MNGCVLPGTGIAVDFWNIRACPSAKLFFLSHLHGDHVTGLTPSWQHPIYCSEVTAALLQEWYHLPASLLHPLEIGVSHVILCPDGQPCRDLSSLSSVLALQKPPRAHDRIGLNGGSRRWDDYDSARNCHGSTGKLSSPQKESGASLMTSPDSITVTLIDANHCPGSVMFVFEGSFGKILHTGDFRLSEEMLQHPALAAVCGKVDRLYLDNTYLHPSCEFPSREEVTKEIIELVREYHDCDIVIGVRNLGKESLLAAVGKALGEDISISARSYKVACLQDLPDVFSINDPNCRIKTVPFMSVSKVQMAKWNKEAPTIAILPTALFSGLDGRPFSQQPSVFVMPYSDHSSYSELMKFVGFIRPKQVIPIVSASARGPFGTSISSRADMSCFSHLLQRGGDECHTEGSSSSGGGLDAAGEAEKPNRGNSIVKAKLPKVDGRRRKELAVLRKCRSLTDSRRCSVTKRRERGIEYDETLLVNETSSAENTSPTVAPKSKYPCRRKASSENSMSTKHIAVEVSESEDCLSSRLTCSDEDCSAGRNTDDEMYTSNGSSMHSSQDFSHRNCVDLHLFEPQGKPSLPGRVSVTLPYPHSKLNSHASNAPGRVHASESLVQVESRSASDLKCTELGNVRCNLDRTRLHAENSTTASSKLNQSFNTSHRNRVPGRRESGCFSSLASEGRTARRTKSDGNRDVANVVMEHRGTRDGKRARREVYTDVADEGEKTRAKRRRTGLLLWLDADDD